MTMRNSVRLDGRTEEAWPPFPGLLFWASVSHNVGVKCKGHHVADVRWLMTLQEASQNPEQEPWCVGVQGGVWGRGDPALVREAEGLGLRFIMSLPLCLTSDLSLPQFSYHGKGSLTQISRFPLSVRGYEQMFLSQAGCGGNIMTSTFISSGHALLGL